MFSVGAFFGTILVQIPVLAVVVLGLVLLATGRPRLPRRADVLAKAGLGVLLAHSVASMTWSALLPQVVSSLSSGAGTYRTIGYAMSIVGFLLSVLFAAGLGLLVAALVGARRPHGSVPPHR